MPFGLVLHSERASKLQQSIQNELIKRGYSPESDNVMAEYLTIMIINNKTPAQITSELEDLIGTDFNSTFTDWLFEEAAKGAVEKDTPNETPSKEEQPSEPEIGPLRDVPPHMTANESLRPSRNGVYQQALSQALPSSSHSGQKRAARSPSPSHPNKFRKTDLPTGPRAMHREGGNPGGSSRSLLDRVGGPAGRASANNFHRDEIQARIDNIVNSATEQSMMMPPGFPTMMEMNSMAANMANPLMLQEMMMNQMALMAQMATSMGIINPATGQFGGQGFPMQPGVVPGDMGMFPPNMNVNNGAAIQQGGGAPAIGNNTVNPTRGRATGRGGRGSGRGRGGSNVVSSSAPLTNPQTANFQPSEVVQPSPPAAIPAPVAPTPVVAAPIPAQPVQPAYAIPERPQSPTLCKFGFKCTNPHCRYSHPSPVATAESGIVLSNDPCEKGKDCKDKDCIKAHVSPAVLNPNAEQSIPKPAPPPPPPVQQNPVPCRFGAACTRPSCTFNHPPRPVQNSIPCRFGAACTRAQCTFQHPEGRVLPSSFHRGLSTTGPMVSVPTPEPGTMGGPSPHRSMTFNNPNLSMKERLEKQMKEIEEKKSQAEKAVKEAEAAANSKKESSNPVSITV